MPAKSKPRPSSPAKGHTRLRRATKARVAALGYASVPAGVALDGPEIDAQRRAIRRGCRALGLDLLDVVHDHEPDESGGERRPGLLNALGRIEAGEAACLIVSDLERLSSSPGELAPVLDRLENHERRLVAVDVGLDTASPVGQLALTRRPGVQPVEPAPEPVAEPAPEPVAEPAPAPEPQPAIEQPPTVELPAADAEPPAEAEPPADAEPPAEPQTAVRAFGYASIPADADSAGTDDLEAQRQAIEARCAQLGLELVEVVREREPKDGKALDRAGVSYLIERLATGDASCLVVSGLERLSHSVAELGTLVQWLEQSKVRLVAVELDLDTVGPGGRTAARALASVGNWERERLSERTRKGLAAARAKRRTGGGPSSQDWAAVRKRIALMRADGMTLQKIADVLNDEGVPTPRGGVKWRPSSVQTAAGYRRRSKAKGVADLPPVANPARPPKKPHQ